MKAKPSLPDTDVFAVARQVQDGTTVFLVTHYPSRASATSCCTARIDRRTDESDEAALARAAKVIERHHGGSV